MWQVMHCLLPGKAQLQRPAATLTCVSCSWDSRVEKSLVSLLDLLSDWVRRPVTLSSSTCRDGGDKGMSLTRPAPPPCFQAKLNQKPRRGASLKQEKEQEPGELGPRRGAAEGTTAQARVPAESSPAAW